MLKVEKVRIYEKFAGDLDAWARVSSHVDPPPIADEDWGLITELLTGLSIVASGLASSSFHSELEAKVFASTADEATREALRALILFREAE